MINPFVLIENYESGKWLTQSKTDLMKTIIGKEWYWKTYTIGRKSDCSIIAQCPKNALSRCHATLIKYRGDKDYTILDGYLGKKSNNGIYLNGLKISDRQLLKDGVIITLTSHLRLTYFSSNLLDKIDDLEKTLSSTDEI